MKKIVFLLVLLAALLSACGGSGAAPTATPVPTKAPTAVSAAAPTPTVPPLPGGCVAVGLLPDPDPLFAPVTSADWVRGPAQARITILEYSDFQCPYCAQIAPILSKLQAAFPNDLRLVYRHFPLAQHDKSLISAQASEAAGVQGKFWEMYDFLMGKQDEWSTKTLTEFETWIKGQAASLGLDAAKFAADLNDPTVVKKVLDGLAAAEKINLDHTPFLVLNGRAYTGNPDEATLTYVVNIFKQIYTMEGKRAAGCPAVTIDKSKQYTATLTTNKGEIVIKLFADKAPLAVNSFVYLANLGYFNNTPFHRVIKDFVAQSGDPSGTGLGNPGYVFNDEIVPDLKFDKEGMVGMANAGAHTNGSQFFITFGALPHLDGTYTIFGQVLKGMDVAKSLVVRDPQDPAAAPADMISKVVIEVK